MNKRIVLNTLLALSIPSISGLHTIPTLAQVQQLPSSSIQNQQVTIPQSSAITIIFPTSVAFDASQKNSLPTTAFLAQPILDSSGNVVAQANSPISIQLQPVKGGAQIKAEALVISGQLIPIQASSSLIPSHAVTIASADQQAQANQGAYSNVASSLFGAFGAVTRASGDRMTNLTNLGNALGVGLGIISGLSSPKTAQRVEIAQGSVHILVLQAAATLPLRVAPTASPIQTPATTPTATPTTPVAPTPETTPPEALTPETTPVAPTPQTPNQ